MAVKKIVRETTGNDLKMQLSSKLNRVREAIRTLPTDTEESTMAKAKTTKSTKADTKATTNGNGGTTLADICKGLKMEPRTARRILRNAEFPVDGNRWVFNGKQAKQAEKVLSDSQSK